MQFGINVATFGFLKLRTGPSGPLTIYRIQEILTVSGKSTTLAFAVAETDWTRIDPKKYPWICKMHDLNGQILDLELLQTYFGAGMADVKLTLLDKSGDPQVLVNRMNIQSSGLLISGARVRGKLEHHYGPVPKSCSA